MTAKSFLPFVFLFAVFIDASIISTSLLNIELKKNYSFVERSLNESDMKIDSSTGNIFFTNEDISIQVLTPFEENYRIREDTIEIHDIFLDQKNVIDIKELDNFFLDLLLEGVDQDSETYSVNIINDSTIQVFENNGLNVVSFSFIGNKLKLIRYQDSLGVEHGIELTLL
ncbi:hypothetical protein N9333_00770 [Gammaproteobacteria bacterium]|jgi:hypothetical protein|nr:hypothetical protein [Gammaproteobacteria bacterium]